MSSLVLKGLGEEGTAVPFSATGGTVTTDGLYTVHTFTEDGTLVCSGAIDGTVDGPRGGICGGNGSGAATLGGSMAVEVAADAVNYAPNPSFELDTNSDGMADGILADFSSGLAGTLIYSRPPALGENGSYAQRFQYTGLAGDVDAQLRREIASPVGSFAPGETATVSLILQPFGLGSEGRIEVLAVDSGGGYLALVASALIAESAEASRYSGTYPSLPAGTDHVLCGLFSKIDEGDVLDLTGDDVLIEKSATAGDYFDGNSGTGCAWSGTPNASASVFTGTVVVRYLTPARDAGDRLVLGGMGGGEEAPVLVTELSCAMRNSAEFEIEPDQRAATMTTGCDMRNGARMSVRPLREGVVLPETDNLGWTAPDAAASPLWDLTVTIGGVRIPNAAITSFPIELDAHGGFESCAISFASKRTRKWPRRAPIVVAYDGMHPFEGRLATQRRSVGTELGWSLEFVGNLNDLRNHRAFRRVYVDSDLDNWRSDQGPNTAANVFEVTAS